MPISTPKKRAAKTAKNAKTVTAAKSSRTAKTRATPKAAQSKRAPARKPGRPRRDDDLRDKILSFAEHVFAEDGFLGASTRKIASRAGVTQSLIRYYFGTKDKLYEEVFRRRGRALAARRHELLDQLIASGPDYTVEDVLRAYLKPQWDLKYDNEAAAFVGLQARLHSEPEEKALRLRRDLYDGPVKRYLEVLQPLLPDIPREVLSLRMSFLVGTYMFMLNDLGRIGDFSQGEVTSLDKYAMVEQLVAFIAAGLRADVTEALIPER